jgi:signal transduction histidine kinase
MGDERDILERVLVLVEDVTEQRLLDRAKSDFVSIASHEMRTPLTIIRGNASMLREDLVAGAGSNPDAVSMVSSIEGSSIRLMKIVNDFLDVIRLEGGQAKLSLQKEPFDFNSIVQGVVADLQAAATKKNISLTFHAPESPLPLAMGDKERAEQVAINLVMNAIQYTDHGGIDVSVKKDGGSIMLTVKDTGIGIAEAFQKNLFQKFGTAGRSFAHSKEYGSGLGLYICKLLADVMAGHLQLEKSVPGAGSTFSFSLPLAAPTV